MMAHIYRHGDLDGLHIATPRVTLRDVPTLDDAICSAFLGSGMDSPRPAHARALILGTLPHITVILFSEINWFWIEEE